MLEARGFSAAVSQELEHKVGELQEAKAELKAAKKALQRSKAEADGRVAHLEALHAKALAEAEEAATATGSANEKRLSKLCASQLQQLQEADESLNEAKDALRVQESIATVATAEQMTLAVRLEVATHELTSLEAQTALAIEHAQAEVDVARKRVGVERSVTASANGRAAAAELEVVSLRTKLRSTEQAVEAKAKEAEVAAAAAREAHAAAIGELREEALRERARHAEVVEGLRAELSSMRESHGAAMARAEESRLRMLRDEQERARQSASESEAEAGKLRQRVAELEASVATMAAEQGRLQARAQAMESSWEAEKAASAMTSSEMKELQQLLASEEGTRRGAQEQANRSAMEAAEAAGQAAEARARVEALHAENEQLRARLDKAVAGAQQENVNQVLQLQGAVTSALATAQAREDAAARMAEQRLLRVQSSSEQERATHEALLKEANAARTKAEAALEALKRDSAAEARRLREGLARAEVQEESLAARLLASEAAAEELRRTYERRLSEQSNQLREARHEGALAVDAERARHEGGHGRSETTWSAHRRARRHAHAAAAAGLGASAPPHLHPLTDWCLGSGSERRRAGDANVAALEVENGALRAEVQRLAVAVATAQEAATGAATATAAPSAPQPPLSPDFGGCRNLRAASVAALPPPRMSVPQKFVWWRQRRKCSRHARASSHSRPSSRRRCVESRRAWRRRRQRR